MSSKDRIPGNSTKRSSPNNVTIFQIALNHSIIYKILGLSKTSKISLVAITKDLIISCADLAPSYKYISKAFSTIPRLLKLYQLPYLTISVYTHMTSTWEKGISFIFRIKWGGHLKNWTHLWYLPLRHYFITTFSYLWTESSDSSMYIYSQTSWFVIYPRQPMSLCLRAFDSLLL